MDHPTPRPSTLELLGLLRGARSILDTLVQLVEEGGHLDPSWEAEAVEEARSIQVRLDRQIRKARRSQAESSLDLDPTEVDSLQLMALGKLPDPSGPGE